MDLSIDRRAAARGAPGPQPANCAAWAARRNPQDGNKRGNVAIFLTGSTGYIGAHVASNLLDEHGASLNVLVRARDQREAELRLWHAMQLHLDFPRFYEYLQTRVR